jgi:hypothetical protein
MISNLTKEQNCTVNSILNGRNVILKALPGSGKSKVAYDIIQKCDDINILMIAYNRALNERSNICVKQLQLKEPKQARSYTFHGLMSVLTGTLCCNDEQFLSGLIKIQKEGTKWKHHDFTLLILDETQDVRPSYFALVRTLVCLICTRPDKLRILLLGDPNQLLYNFYNFDRADSRFLTLGYSLFSTFGKWDSLSLTQSFRSTFPVATFLNALIPHHKMVPRNHDPCSPVDLYLCNTYKDPARYILSILENNNYKPSDILILCPSLNERSPAKMIVRTLIRAGIHVTVSRSGRLSDVSETSNISEPDAIQVKTYCSSKGLEASLVIVLNSRRELFDNLENSTYVALSRSVHKLIIFHDLSYVTPNHINTIYQHIQETTAPFTNILQTHIIHNDGIFHIQTVNDIEISMDMLKQYKKPTVSPGPNKVPYRTVQQLFTYAHTTVLQEVRKFYSSTIIETGVKDIIFEDETINVNIKNTKVQITADTDTMIVPHIVNIDGIFGREFDNGIHNMMNIVGDVCELLIEYHLSHRVRQCIRKLGRIYNESADTYIQTVYNFGREHLQSCPPYDGNMYTLSQYIPAFTFFSLSSDAWYGFEDRIHSVTDYSFAQRPSVLLRIQRILNIISPTFSYPLQPGAARKTSRKRIAYTTKIQNQETWFQMDLEDRGDGWICSNGTNCGLMIVHTQNTTDSSRMLACCRLYMFDLEIIYVCNTWSGSVERVERNLTDSNKALSNIISYVMQEDDILDDFKFIDKYKCKTCTREKKKKKIIS